MSTHHAPTPPSAPPGASAGARSSAARVEPRDDRWEEDDEWDDWEYEVADPGGQILWGRVAVLAGLLLTAFVLGRVTASGVDEEVLAQAQDRIEVLTGELRQAREELDAVAAGAASGTDPAAAADPAGTDAAAADAAQADDAPADAGVTADAGAAAPADTAPDAAEQAGETYVVQSGDFLYDLAERFYGDGAQWGRIAEANGLGANPTLEVGQSLRIPPAPQG